MGMTLAMVEPWVVAAWMKRLNLSTELHEDVRSAVAFIANHLSERLSVDLIAEEACVGRRTLERRFRQAAGCSIQQVMTGLRLEAGARLLRRTPLSVSLIAVHVGMDDVAQFSRSFRRVFGCTPTEFRTDVSDK